MQLSIIIVNFNVKYFLEHCLLSVQAACKNISAEIIVVDNASEDGSVSLVKNNFPTVILIDNKNNVGFAKANNQALAMAKGEYILFLNPDTIVAEDGFEKCINYFSSHKSVGALGVRLIDGKGNFLPESKRGFPSFSAAFFKISGLSNIFKKSTIFNKYHLGYLPEMQTSEVDVLVGCYMMMPKKVLDITGGFSEDYFMYGEDIDLSFCVQKAGFKNIYFPETTVIHYKGESTKKGSLNYVKLFYNAMIIFAQKHLAQSSQRLFIPLIKLAIGARAILSVANRFLSALWLPILDCIIMLVCLMQTKIYWLQFIKPNTVYNKNLVTTFFTIYIITWLLSLFFNGAYDKPLKKYKILIVMLIGVVLTTSVYGLLPETIRFSRGITLIGAMSSAVIIWMTRMLMQLFGIESVQKIKSSSIITVADEQQKWNIKKLLAEAGIEKDIAGNVYNVQQNTNDLGSLENLKNIAQLYKAGEIIFAYPSISFKNIIATIENIGVHFNYKIHGSNTESIIGSNSKNTAGDLYASDWHFKIATASGRRSKRVFDVLSSLLLIVFYPILFWRIKVKNIFGYALQVLLASKTWIGYENNSKKLPQIKPHIFSVFNHQQNAYINTNSLNLLYARNYESAEDWKILFKQLF